ncbi:MAG: DEAD/DEAH box helicase family protein [Candidatus Sungbacteria bacterium]|nr:DEAD/DEAH box helicase family protein [Candidatus Sungbacteria bacterium]
MAFQLTKYQHESARELLQDAKRLLRQTGNKKLVFKAPTGSGKTIMMAEFLARFVDDHDHPPCAFIWAAPRQLHEQSKRKLELYFENTRAMDCSFFEDLDDRQIGENEILFFNWESIRQENNIYIRENEQENNLSNIVERTRKAGRAIVLVIDESHFHAQAETSQNLIVAISPNLTIEVSATPVMQNPDRIVSADIEDVKAEQMIKKAVILNEDFKSVVHRGRTETIKSELAGSTDEIVLREALKKREELVRAYKAAGVVVNPLLLIQLPDRRGQADEDREAMIARALKDKHGISVENGKLAIYLSENKENLENLTMNDNEVDVLIFKQAIALGWDCPRAHILVLFREWHSPVFSIQTLGRIMRVSEPERGYYDNDILNFAYVYTNIDDIEIKEDIGGGYVVIHTSKRSAKYKLVHLPSVHRKRHREQTRLNPIFTALFLEEAQKYTSKDKKGLEKAIKLKGQRVAQYFISDWKSENIDELKDAHIVADQKAHYITDTDLQRLFDYFVRKNLSPFYPEDRSVGRLKKSIYKFFDKRLGMTLADHFHDIINITLSEENRPHFEAVIDSAKRAYIAATEKQEKELVGDVWEVPERLAFGEGYVETDAKKSVMEPFFSNEHWQSEKAFIDFLEKPRNNVLLWFKNGDRDATFFAVPYKDGDDWSPFYVDFVVMMKDGSIGLFDPHSSHLTDFAAKSDGLQAYIAGLKKKGRKVSGGIVANTDPRTYTGQWMVYDGSGKGAREGDWDNWKQLQL